MTIDRADFLRVDGANDFPSFVYSRRIRLVFRDLFETCICNKYNYSQVFYFKESSFFFLILFKMVIAL